jgi:hypothetical protein
MNTGLQHLTHGHGHVCILQGWVQRSRRRSPVSILLTPECTLVAVRAISAPQDPASEEPFTCPGADFGKLA